MALPLILGKWRPSEPGGSRLGCGAELALLPWQVWLWDTGWKGRGNPRSRADGQGRAASHPQWLVALARAPFLPPGGGKGIRIS